MGQHSQHACHVAANVWATSVTVWDDTDDARATTSSVTTSVAARDDAAGTRAFVVIVCALVANACTATPNPRISGSTGF